MKNARLVRRMRELHLMVIAIAAATGALAGRRPLDGHLVGIQHAGAHHEADEVAGRIALRVFLVGRVADANVVEIGDTQLAQEALPVLGAYERIGWSVSAKRFVTNRLKCIRANTHEQQHHTPTMHRATDEMHLPVGRLSKTGSFLFLAHHSWIKHLISVDIVGGSLGSFLCYRCRVKDA